ncbi:MAG: PAS domain-containing protein [Alphaproteobacteria bacterium]
MIAVRLDLRLAADASADVLAGDDTRRDGVGGAMVEVGPQGEVIGFDAAAEKLFGYAAEEVLGLPIAVLMPALRSIPDTNGREPERHAAARHKNGTVMDLDLSVVSVRLDGVWVASAIGNPAEEGRRQAESQLQEAAARYQDATRIAKLGHWIYDEVADRITFVSEELARIHGVTPQEYIDQVQSTDADIMRVHPEDREHFGDAVRYARENGTPYDVEYRIVRPDGEVRHIREIGEPTLDNTGRLIQSHGTLQDISERRMREEQLAESEAKFRHAERIANLIHWHTDPADFMNWTDVSDNAEKLFGRPKEELLGEFSNYAQIIHPNDLLRVEAQYLRNNEERRTYELEYRILRPNREVRWFREVGEPAFDDAGMFLGYRGTTQDVSDRKKVERDLEQARIEAEASNRAKTEFLANMSHELRTPLNSIIGFSELMQGEIFGVLGDARYRGYVGDIEFSAQHLLSLITDILDISKIESGSFELEDSTFTVPDLIESCLSIVRPRAIHKHHSIDESIAADLPHVLADNRVMRQVLLNILSNAIKFTPESGRISVTAQRADGGGIVLSVSDTGIGIAPEDIAAVVEPFTQVGRNASESNEGTGLGLALSKRMVEAHGGILTLESELGQGTTAHVILPPGRCVVADETPAAAGQAD